MTTGLLASVGAKQVSVAVTHPLFCEYAEAHILLAGVKRIWNTDSINHSIACIHLGRFFADAITKIF